jgi:DNA-binding NtrC family response regulator
VFVLRKNRRLQYANPAWEKLTGIPLADALGMVCSARRHSSALAAALAPTPESLAGRTDTARRPAPPHRTGPPWWDVSFAPLAGDDGPLGVVGFVAVVGEPVPAAARKIPATVMALRDQHAAAFTLDLLAGSSPVAERFVAQVRLAAQTAAPVWLVGEPGSGKETTARVIHHSGIRREQTFVGIDCAGLQPYLIESLLSGHGGLTGSDRVGTVYLKDPAALPRDVQQSLAELFTDGKPNTPRLVCGSARTAAEDARDRGLIPDFHANLSVLELRVPPLRERSDEIARIVSRMVEPATAIDPGVFEVASAYPWPGNLRELRDVLAGAVAAAGTGRVTREHLPWELRVRAGIAGPPPAAAPLKLDPILEAVEKRLIQLALRKAGGNATKAAEQLGIWRARLLRRVQALGIGEADSAS